MPSVLRTSTPGSRIGILGGTFDPPHMGHLVLGECARVQFGLERVLFMPAGHPYRKARGKDSGLGTRDQSREVTAVEHRVAMTRLAIEGNPHFVLDDREIRRSGPTYTVDTLEELTAESKIQNPKSNIVLILGSDAVTDMPNWKDPARILALATIVVALKDVPPGAEPPRTIPLPAVFGAPAPALSPESSVLSTVLMPRLGISSTLIRSRAAADLPIRYLVPEAVEAYIREHGLYARPDVRVRGDSAQVPL